MSNEVVTFSQVYIFIMNLSKRLRSLIPQNFIDLILEQVDKQYIDNYTFDIDNLDFTKDAEILIGIIYRDYLCENEKDELVKKEQEEIKKITITQNDLITIKPSIGEKTSIDNTKLAVLNIEKEKWYKKIIKKIINFFSKK